VVQFQNDEFSSIESDILSGLKTRKHSKFLNKKAIIDDTTLREGEQTPGVVFSVEDKVNIARRLDEIGVQRIEAGFPAASQGEMEAMKAIMKEGLETEILGFARAVKSDIDAVVQCGCFGVMLSFPPSDIHLKYKLGISREEYLARAVDCVEYAKDNGLYVTYSAEDSTRTELSFLLKVFKTLIDRGIDCPRIVDTLGIGTPKTMSTYVSAVKELTSLPLEVHCHDDHGMAVANSIAAFEAGASVISTAVNGLGERAGIAPTEEVIMALHNLYGIHDFRTKGLYNLCKFVEKVSGIVIPAGKPVSGENVFCHVSGIHQAAILKHTITYEPYPPEIIGRKRTFILGKLSGSHAVEAKLKEYGILVSRNELEKITRKVKALSEVRKSAITDNEFLHLVEDLLGRKIVESS